MNRVTDMSDLFLWLWGGAVAGIAFWYFTVWPFLAGVAYAIHTKQIRYALYGLAGWYLAGLAALVIYFLCCFRITLP